MTYYLYIVSTTKRDILLKVVAPDIQKVLPEIASYLDTLDLSQYPDSIEIKNFGTIDRIAE